VPPLRVTLVSSPEHLCCSPFMFFFLRPPPVPPPSVSAVLRFYSHGFFGPNFWAILLFFPFKRRMRFFWLTPKFFFRASPSPPLVPFFSWISSTFLCLSEQFDWFFECTAFFLAGRCFFSPSFFFRPSSFPVPPPSVVFLLFFTPLRKGTGAPGAALPFGLFPFFENRFFFFHVYFLVDESVHIHNVFLGAPFLI